ncbi:MAG: Fic family protein [Puniceicoccales bacterium]|jgi:Fic family protein|nr:Fic family protein [Puniceicoccales bacterium]
MGIEASKTTIDELHFSVQLLASLRESSKLLTTHYSTRIEGNGLDAEQVKQLIVSDFRFAGRKRDEREVLNYYRALGYVEQLVHEDAAICERKIQTIASLVKSGKSQPKPYREGQNVIRNSETNGIVYMPPRATDVPQLMASLVAWISENIASKSLPIPMVAGLAHYQFATIHPYFDGNGRTARLLASWILQKTGYGLKGIYSLEEYYAKNLPAYYRALNVSENHNYYDGRADADITPFLEYFCGGMAVAFQRVEVRAKKQIRGTDQDVHQKILLPEQRQVLALFEKHSVVTAADVARELRVSDRQARAYCKRWTSIGFLVIADHSKRLRRYAVNGNFGEGN